MPRKKLTNPEEVMEQTNVTPEIPADETPKMNHIVTDTADGEQTISEEIVPEVQEEAAVISSETTETSQQEVTE